MDALWARLQKNLAQLGQSGLCIAFSGGVDSALLLKAAAMAADRVVGVTCRASLQPAEDIAAAKLLAREIGVPHAVVRIDGWWDISCGKNAADQCYHYKKSMFSALLEYARIHGYGQVADGSTADDLHANQPAFRALSELKIASPLAACGIGQADVRRLAGELEINADGGPFASSSASKMPYAQQKLMIDQAAALMQARGFRKVKVSIHSNGDSHIASITVDEAQLEALCARRDELIESIKAIGFDYVTLDMEGIRLDSMDHHLQDDDQ